MNAKPPGLRITAAALVALAAGSALVFALAYPLPAVQNDAVSYLALAQNVASGKGFTENGVLPAVYRPPLFSLLLGGWFRLTGTSSPFSAAVFQSLEHGAAILVAYLLLLDVAPSRRWATAGAVWLAVNPLLTTRVAFVLQEPTLVLFTTLAAWLSVRFVRGPSAGRAALAGAAWGLCTLGKVVAWFAPLVIPAMWLLPRRLRPAWRGWEVAALLLCFTAVVAPWTVRNYVHFGQLIPVNGQGEGMLKWNVAHAAIPGEQPGAEFVAEVYGKELSPEQRKARLWDYVLEHPGHFFFRRIIRNAVHFAAPPRGWWDARGYFAPGQHGPVFWTLSILFHVPLYVVLLLRSVQWWKGTGSASLGFLLLLYWAYWAQHAVLWGDPRFGLAVYPTLIAIAVAAPGGTERVPPAAVRTPRPV